MLPANLPIHLEQTVPNASIKLDDFPEFGDFIQAQYSRQVRHVAANNSHNSQ